MHRPYHQACIAHIIDAPSMHIPLFYMPHHRPRSLIAFGGFPFTIIGINNPSLTKIPPNCMIIVRAPSLFPIIPSPFPKLSIPLHHSPSILAPPCAHPCALPAPRLAPSLRPPCALPRPSLRPAVLVRWRFYAVASFIPCALIPSALIPSFLPPPSIN